jgi:uncharacterized surface anchored protein
VEGTRTFTIKTQPEEDQPGVDEEASWTNEVGLFEGVPEAGAKALATDADTVKFKIDWVGKNGEYKQRAGDDEAYLYWTITLNKDGKGLIPAGSYVEDIIPAELRTYLKFDTDFFELDNDLIDVSEESSIEFTENHTVIYTFSQGINEEVKITLRMEVLDDYFQQQGITSFINSATLYITDNESPFKGHYPGKSGAVGVRTSLLAKSGVSYDPSTQIITWELEVNGNGRTITDPKIVDVIGDNQSLYTDGYVVKFKNGDNIPVRAEGTNKPYYEIDNGQLTVYLEDLTPSDKPVLQFRTKVTKVDDYAKNHDGVTYMNQATLTGGGIEPSTSKGQQLVTSEVVKKSFIEYDHVAGVFDWKIVVNKNKMKMLEAKVTDIIGVGHIYVENSIMIDGAEVLDNDLRINLNEVGGKIQPEINLGSITDEVVITLQTEVEDWDIFLTENDNITFHNEVILKFNTEGGVEITQESDDEHSVSNKTVEKTGEKVLFEDAFDGSIRWTVDINVNQAALSNTSITDILQAGLDLDLDSVQLFKLNLTSDGTLTPGDAVQPNEAQEAGSYYFTYGLNGDGKREFKVYLPDGPQGYRLVYETYVEEGQAGPYANEVELAGLASGEHKSEGKVTILQSDFGSNITSQNGSIKITKLDEDGEPLKGARFVILFGADEEVKGDGYTDDDGVIEFGNLRYRSFLIRELEAPLGYARMEDVPVSISRETPNIVKEFSNSLQRADISFKKTDIEGTGIQGAIFGIYRIGDTNFEDQLAEATSDIDGLVTFENMTFGSYMIKEEAPPPGYIAAEPFPVEFMPNSENILEEYEHDVDIINEFDGKITITKRGASGFLAGVTFELLDEDEEPYGEPSSKVTGSNGQVVFEELPLGTYYIRETAVPGQYHLPSTLHKVELTAEFNEENETFGWHQELEIRNYLLTDSIILTKTDPKGVALDGGWFGLYTNSAATGEPMDKVQADGGQVVFTGIFFFSFIEKDRLGGPWSG